MGVLEVLALRTLEMTRNLPAKEAFESHPNSLRFQDCRNCEELNQ